MDSDIELLPLTKIDGREFLVDVEHREFRDFDDPCNVIKMHTLVGRRILRKMQGTYWNSSGISTGRQKGLAV
jgi:hypothetical protein